MSRILTALRFWKCKVKDEKKKHHTVLLKHLQSSERFNVQSDVAESIEIEGEYRRCINCTYNSSYISVSDIITFSALTMTFSSSSSDSELTRLITANSLVFRFIQAKQRSKVKCTLKIL